MSNNTQKPSSITLLIDLAVASKMSSQIPVLITEMFPNLAIELKQATSDGVRFFGFVVVPGSPPVYKTELCMHMSFIEDTIVRMMDYSGQHGPTSKWLIVSDKITKKQLTKIVDKKSLGVKIEKK